MEDKPTEKVSEVKNTKMIEVSQTSLILSFLGIIVVTVLITSIIAALMLNPTVKSNHQSINVSHGNEYDGKEDEDIDQIKEGEQDETEEETEEPAAMSSREKAIAEAKSKGWKAASIGGLSLYVPPKSYDPITINDGLFEGMQQKWIGSEGSNDITTTYWGDYYSIYRIVVGDDDRPVGTGANVGVGVNIRTKPNSKNFNTAQLTQDYKMFWESQSTTEYPREFNVLATKQVGELSVQEVESIIVGGYDNTLPTVQYLFADGQYAYSISVAEESFQDDINLIIETLGKK